MGKFTILILVTVLQGKHMSRIIKLYNLTICSFAVYKLYYNKTVKQKAIFYIITCLFVFFFGKQWLSTIQRTSENLYSNKNQ